MVPKKRAWKPMQRSYTVVHMELTPVLLPGKSQGWGSLVGCRLWGHTESDTTEATSLSLSKHQEPAVV